MKCLYLVFLVGLTAGCTVPAARFLIQRDMNLAEVESLPIGKATGEELRKKFGEPEKVLTSPAEVTWLYYGHGANTAYQRASFVLDKEKGLLLSAAWIPNEREALHIKEAALAYFNGANFQAKEVGWIAHHEYSSETDYSDPRQGVSLRVNETTHNVIMIGFSEKAGRPLAGQE